jgi:hypothetical protein
MTLNDATKLAIVEIAIYAIIAPFTLWLAFKHGRIALIAFPYLVIFEVLRIAADAIQISDRDDATPSETAAIVNSVGLSPLLLACAGMVEILWRAHLGRAQRLAAPAQTLIHVGAIVGLALSVLGVTKLFGGTVTQSKINKGHHEFEAGAVILLLTYLALVLMILNLIARIGRDSPMAGLAMFVAVLCLGGRVGYTVVYAFDHDTDLSPITGKFVVKLIVLFLVPLLVALALLTAAFVSQHQARQDRSRRGETRDIEYTNGNMPLTSSNYK